MVHVERYALIIPNAVPIQHILDPLLLTVTFTMNLCGHFWRALRQLLT